MDTYYLKDRRYEFTHIETPLPELMILFIIELLVI
mgnify:FL=1